MILGVCHPVTGLCVCFCELVSVCSGIGRGERGLCFTIVHHCLVTDGLVTDVGWAELGCWYCRATVPVGQLCRGHSVEAPHLSRSGNRTHLTIFRVISPLWPFPALGFAFAICAESLKLQSTLSVDNEIRRIGIALSSMCAFKFK